MAYYNDLTGQVFGRLEVISRAKNDKWGNAQWLCKCSCGKEKIVRGRTLMTGMTKSCGCLLSEESKERMKKIATKHGKSNLRINKTYRSMKDRCCNPNCRDYKNYGGRGITICKEWLDNFMNFYNWAMATGYSDNLTIERINVNGNYEPSNCTWIPKEEQAQNQRKSRKVQIDGKSYTTVARACKNEPICPTTLYKIINGYNSEILQKHKILEIKEETK